MIILYIIIVLISTTAGAIAGVGGGVIIKPVLDALGQLDLETIGILSSAAVLAMATVSIIQRTFAGLVIDKKIVLLGIGAIVGGITGKFIFYWMTGTMDDNIVKLVQTTLLMILMGFILFKGRFKRICIENIFIIVIIGVVLGFISSFLGIGGGPVNVAVIYTFLKLDIRKSAVGSILIILLAQATKLIAVGIDGGFAVCDSGMLYYMMAAGAVGGIAGTILQKNMRRKTLSILFNSTVVLVIILSAYNIIASIASIW